jgi:hypothetical protein
VRRKKAKGKGQKAKGKGQKAKGKGQKAKGRHGFAACGSKVIMSPLGKVEMSP